MTPPQHIAPPADGIPMPRRIWAILAVAFGVSLSVIDSTIANVALPTISRALGISSADLAKLYDFSIETRDGYE